MKKIVLVFNALILICLFSCDKKDNFEFDKESPFKAKRNGENWISTGSWANHSKALNRFAITGANQNERLTIWFDLLDFQNPKAVNNFNSKWSNIDGGDVVADQYLMDSNSNNIVQISAIDTIKKQISGVFVTKLIREYKFSKKGEVFLFTEGQFNLTYNDVSSW